MDPFTAGDIFSQNFKEVRKFYYDTQFFKKVPLAIDLPQPSSVEENKYTILKVLSNGQLFSTLGLLLNQAILSYPLFLFFPMNCLVLDWPTKSIGSNGRMDKNEHRNMILNALIFASLFLTIDVDPYGNKEEDKAEAEKKRIEAEEKRNKKKK